MTVERTVTAVAGNVITLSDHSHGTAVDVGTGTTLTSNGAHFTLEAGAMGVKIEVCALPRSTSSPSSTAHGLRVDIATQGHDHGGDHGHGHGHH